MATLPIDSSKIVLVATGKVRPVAVYAEQANGEKVRVPGAQEKSDFGLPLWAVDVLLDDDDANRAEAISVKVPSADEPQVPKFQPVQFEGLTCKPWKGRSNQVELSMRAESIVVASAPTSSRSSKASAE